MAPSLRGAGQIGQAYPSFRWTSDSAGPVQPQLPPRSRERQLITDLLSLIRKNSEVRQYLKHFSSVTSERFAIIRLSGDITHDADLRFHMAKSLAFLHRVGLLPVVVHGAGVFTGRRSQQLAATIAAAERSEAEGDEAHAMAVRHMEEAAAALVAELEGFGVQATPILDTFSAEPDDEATGPLAGVMGRVTDVDLRPIQEAVAAGRLPVVCPVGRSETGGGGGGGGGIPLTFPTIVATAELAARLQPLKVVLLRPEGGLQIDPDTPEEEEEEEEEEHVGGRELQLRAVALGDNDLPPVRPSDEATLQQAAFLLEGGALPRGCTVSITDPPHLAKELFSHQGAGTQVWQPEPVTRLVGIPEELEDPLRALLEDAFGGRLPADYFSEARRQLQSVYLSESQRAVAVVFALPLQLADGSTVQVSYLDKFAVAGSAQGEKLGELVWKALVAGEPRLFWRSRTANPVNAWYTEQADGSFKGRARVEGRGSRAQAAPVRSPVSEQATAEAAQAARKFAPGKMQDVRPKGMAVDGCTGQWTVFWRGLASIEEVNACVGKALRLKSTFGS